MKYLKYFENINQLKDYIIFRDFDNIIYIIKILSKAHTLDIPYKKLYRLDNNNLYELTNDNCYYHSSIYIKKNALFQSDDLNYCKDNIIQITKIKKYNL